MADNGTIIQYFEWYLPSDKTLWSNVAKNAENLAKTGFTAVWLPPAYKGANGVNDVGYGVYDVYDLGEFNQKGTIPTKYGTKEEYLNAIKALHKFNIQVYADVVLNHKMGADATEQVIAEQVDKSNRNKEITGEQTIEAWTKFDFPGRNSKYSDFKWNYTHFDGIDWDQKTNSNNIYLFEGKEWQQEVDDENCNYDYLMGADLDFNNQQVIDELIKWGKWYLDTTAVDGVRLDAVKHIAAQFYEKWLPEMRTYKNTELFAVGEYWHGSKQKLENYLAEVVGDMSLFDVPLHYNFFAAANQMEEFDLSKIFDNSLVMENPTKAVTFVDNHDTQPGQALASFVNSWFKPIAYALILLMQSGYPCVFYGDYYGIPHDNIPPIKELPILVAVRKSLAYGNQNSYFDNKHIIGFTREGDQQHINSGVAVLISNGGDGEKQMYVGIQHANKQFIDVLNNSKPSVVIDEKGWGLFSVNNKYVAVYTIKP